VTDLLDLYFNDHAKKDKEQSDFLLKVATFAFEHGDKTRTLSIIEKIIEYVLIKFKTY